MTVLLYFLTVVMVFDCVLLVFLVLLQLPKKEAGAGMAFGGAATDALFGAGSGNVLTKITKYVAAMFFLLALLMAVISAHRSSPGHGLQEELTKPGVIPTELSAPPPATPPSNSPLQAPLLTNIPASSATPSPGSDSGLPAVLPFQAPAAETNK
jgi:preprotein translocase subunit SecG